MKALMNLLERRTLITKLALGFSIFLLLAILLGFFGLRTQQSMNRQIQQTFESDLLGLSNAKEAQIQYNIMGRTLRHALIVSDTNKRDQAIKDLTDAQTRMDKEIDAMRPRLFRDDAKTAMAKFDENLSTYKKNVSQAISLIQNNRVTEATDRVSSDAFRVSGAAASATLSAVVQMIEEGSRKAALEMQQLGDESARLMLLFLGFGCPLGLLMSWMIVLSIRRPAERIRLAVEQLAQGQLDTTVPHADFSNETGNLARSVLVLQAGAKEIDAQAWIKSNLALVSGALQTAVSFGELSRQLFSQLAKLIHIGHGVFYIHEEDANRLRLLGTYAYRERKDMAQYFDFGQGLVGQCALERTPMVISEPPPDYVHIGSSLGEATPSTIAVLPVLRNERLLGVLEIATFNDFGDKEQALLEGLMPILAMNLEILERNVKTNKLLNETRLQAERMERQAALLEEQSVEMEAQQVAIKATEDWYRSIIESAPDGMLVTDEQPCLAMPAASWPANSLKCWYLLPFASSMWPCATVITAAATTVSWAAKAKSCWVFAKMGLPLPSKWACPNCQPCVGGVPTCAHRCATSPSARWLNRPRATIQHFCKPCSTPFPTRCFTKARMRGSWVSIRPMSRPLVSRALI
jgi:putative methionine-R-sulfoxide reductase with GAF domain/HAMP domain-containing protein